VRAKLRSGRTTEAQDTTNTGTGTQRYNYDYQERVPSWSHDGSDAAIYGLRRNRG
jgi:hypothetical protein